jgi:hypothetical protein
MLEEILVPILEEDSPDDMLFQQDGALPHFRKEVTDFLNSKFSDLKSQFSRYTWIGRSEPIAWPPRSPDLTPPDFFFQGYIKDCTCHHWLPLCRNLMVV